MWALVFIYIVGASAYNASLELNDWALSDSDSIEVNDPYDTVKIVSGYKYPIKEYKVHTADGYILKVHRMYCNNERNRNNRSVLIMNDYWSSSVFWVMSGPKYSLAFYLADLGYDVWLGNNRGSKYGQDGKVLKPKDPAFWYYSIHEYGVYDLPAIVDFILKEVNCQKINYIGWGYGATQFFVMASVKSEYVKKFKNMQALTPTVYLKHLRSQLLVHLSKLEDEAIYKLAGKDVVLTTKPLLNAGGRKRCCKLAKDKSVCDFIQPLALEEFDPKIPGYPDVLNYPKVQAATRFFVHIMQQIRHGFRYYDNGKKSNLYFYGEKCPPKYNISAAKLPIALYYSDGDAINAPEDVLDLANDLPNVIGTYKINEDNFGYNDYPLSKQGRELYFPQVKKVLESYN